MREYSLRLDGFTRAIRRGYELARWKVWQEMMPHYKKGQAPTSPEAYFRFEWEEPTEEEIAERKEESKISPEQVAELNRLVALHLNKTQRNNG